VKITDLLKKDTMILELDSDSKPQIIDELVSKLDEAGRLNDKDEFKQAIQAREDQSTTGIGEGVAIPHAKSAAVKEPAIAFARSQDGADYESLDGQPTHLFFMIAASEGANQEHLETLSSLSSLLMDANFREKLLEAESKDKIIELINDKESEGDEEEEAEEETTSEDREEAYVVAVTACPTGIAHTYMAADKLKETAKEMGIKIKVETNGSSGVKNALTSEDIEKATGVIVAADIEVETDRFKGKPTLTVPVAKGIHEPKNLIEKAANGDAPIYEGGSNAADGEEGEDGSFVGGGEKKGFYKHLMNGVSNMLPFVVGGGILIALSFFWGIEATDPDSPEYNQFAAWLSTIGGGKAFFLLVPVLAGFIAQSIAGRPGLAPGMVGGLIAIQETGGIEGAGNGSGFLGGLIAGFLAGYVVLLIQKGLTILPETLDGLKPVLFYPVFGLLITGVLMILINPPLVSIYAGLQNWLDGLGNLNIVLGLLLGGMMAVDMGGPVNKAAYTFGLAMIDANNYAPIAAIMAGGMVPPLGLALATTFFKNKFTKQERETGKTAYAMGASFITEGAIPFAAADPARVITSSVIGSAITGALVMLFGITLRAPHGGIFVFPFVNSNVDAFSGGFIAPLFYSIAIIAGAIVTAVLVGLLKKDAKIT